MLKEHRFHGSEQKHRGNIGRIWRWFPTGIVKSGDNREPAGPMSCCLANRSVRMLEHMVDDRANLEFHDGDYVTLLNDDWATVGCNLVLVAAEPVPGSTQCIVEANGESMVVSRNDLRLRRPAGSAAPCKKKQGRHEDGLGSKSIGIRLGGQVIEDRLRSNRATHQTRPSIQTIWSTHAGRLNAVPVTLKLTKTYLPDCNQEARLAPRPVDRRLIWQLEASLPRLSLGSLPPG